ncbi:MAG: DnaD domain protein [Defluviitaleaceae bacterium]|nr:DnaD domain protein [Defluviitaleaceae bacterium]
MLSILPQAVQYTDNTGVQIPADFVDRFLASSACVNPLYVVVYLFALRHMGGGSPMQVSRAAAQLEISEANVLAALHHWASVGVLSLRLEGGLVFAVFGDKQDKPPEAGHGAGQNSTGQNSTGQNSTGQNEAQKTSAVSETHVLSVLPEHSPSIRDAKAPRPNYTPDELEIYGEREEIRALFLRAQEHLKRTLNHNDMNQLFGFYDWLRLPTPVIDRLLAYCREGGHTNMSYIERVALDWAEQGIDTCAKADEYIQLFNRDFRDILRAFGIFGRNPSAGEQDFMRTWLVGLDTPRDMVLWACDQAVLNTGGVSFSYADKIIRRWHEDGVRTLDAAKASSEARKSPAAAANTAEKKPRRAKKDRTPPKTSNRYLNFKQRDYDFEQMEAMEFRRLKEEYLRGGADEQRP